MHECQIEADSQEMPKHSDTKSTQSKAQDFIEIFQCFEKRFQ
jgi:hypothetical protein